MLLLARRDMLQQVVTHTRQRDETSAHRSWMHTADLRRVRSWLRVPQLKSKAGRRAVADDQTLKRAIADICAPLVAVDVGDRRRRRRLARALVALADDLDDVRTVPTARAQRDAARSAMARFRASAREAGRYPRAGRPKRRDPDWELWDTLHAGFVGALVALRGSVRRGAFATWSTAERALDGAVDVFVHACRRRLLRDALLLAPPEQILDWMAAHVAVFRARLRPYLAFLVQQHMPTDAPGPLLARVGVLAQRGLHVGVGPVAAADLLAADWLDLGAEHLRKLRGERKRNERRWRQPRAIGRLA